MKLLLAFIVIIGQVLFGYSQNNTLRGKVKVKNQGEKYLADVMVSAHGADSVFTNQYGIFEI